MSCDGTEQPAETGETAERPHFVLEVQDVVTPTGTDVS